MLKQFVITSLIFSFIVTSCTENTRNEQAKPPKLAEKPPNEENTAIGAKENVVKDTTRVVTNYILNNYIDIPGGEFRSLESVIGLISTKGLDSTNLDHLKAYVLEEVLQGTMESTCVGFDDHYIKQRYFHHVYNNLPDFMDKKERHMHYYHGCNKSSQYHKLMAYAIYRIDRSAENLDNLYHTVKPWLATLRLKERDDSLQIKVIVDDLIYSYRFISELPDYKQRLDSAYKLVWSYWQGEHYDPMENDAYGRTIWDDMPYYKKYLDYQRYRDLYTDIHQDFWVFTFWVRRFHEGNMDTVYRLLLDFRKIYD